ncbi:MAG: lysophospholipid acyltransferase family protein [Bacteroidota bacterium]
MKRLAYFILRLIVALFALLPFWYLYRLSDGLAFLLHYLLRYRRGVIDRNLKAAFPQKSEAEWAHIRRKFYTHFTDVLLESIKGLSLGEAELRRRYRYLNAPLPDQVGQQRSSAILVGSHLGNWEWGVLSVSLWMQTPVMGVFKPLSNEYVEGYLNRLRRQWGLQLCSMKQAGRVIFKPGQPNTLFVFIADQTPSDTQNAHWLPFLHQDTPFLPGPDKVARKTSYPVYYFDIRRVKRGYYEVKFEELAVEPGGLPEGEISRRFARRLEQRLQEEPYDWLWSHRRWKHSRAVPPP